MSGASITVIEDKKTTKTVTFAAENELDLLRIVCHFLLGLKSIEYAKILNIRETFGSDTKKIIVIESGSIGRK